MKKILGMTVIIAALGAVFLWWLGGAAATQTTARAEESWRQVITTPTQSADIVRFVPTNEPDSDGDGLRDWEENWWQTDKTNPDSDQDGTPDGEEVAAGRNPKLKAKNDRLQEPEERLSVVIRNATVKKGAPLAASLGEIKPLAKKLTTLDLNIVTTTDREAVLAYGRAVAIVIKKYVTANYPNEMRVVLDSLSNNRPEALTTVKQASELYAELVAELQKQPVPLAAASAHLELVNALSELRQLSSVMATAFDEPVAALSAVKLYPAAYLRLLTAYQKVNQFFASQGVIWSERERIVIPLKF